MNSVDPKVALYMRVSVDDGTGETSSITSQRMILEGYCRKQGWRDLVEYVDDGYSGRNLSRPGLQRLLADAKSKALDVVVVKDLSRLGRNYIEVGTLVQTFFPLCGIRFVALSDAVDTSESISDMVPFKNILNEMYSRDLGRKIHASRLVRAKQGLYCGRIPPFGYAKDPEKYGHLIVDEEMAVVVRLIFDLASDGWGGSRIARELLRRRIPKPGVWIRERGHPMFLSEWEKRSPDVGRYVWNISTIGKMLTNPVYVGSVVSQKFDASRGHEHRAVRPREDWIIVENCHEPIISWEQFAKVQELVNRRKRRFGGDPDASKYSGRLYCAECGRAMAHRCENDKKRTGRYACKSYQLYGPEVCSAHSVSDAELDQVVLTQIHLLSQAPSFSQYALVDEVTKSLVEETIEKMTLSQDAENGRLELSLLFKFGGNPVRVLLREAEVRTDE